MTPILIVVALIVAALAWYVFFRRPKNQFLSDIAEMPPEQRANVLVQATVFRVTWERDNPDYSGIFLEPVLYSSEICDRLFSDVLNIVVQLRKQHEESVKYLRDRGVSETLPDDDINGCRVWIGTIGARCGKTKLEDAVALWSYLREAVPFIDGALAELKSKHELNLKLRITDRAFMGGLSIQQLAQEARRIPNQSAFSVRQA